MNWVDLVIIATVALFASESLKRGFFSQVFDIIGFSLSLLLALFLYPLLASAMENIFKLGAIAANPIAFLIIWVIAETLFFAMFDRAFRVFMRYFRHTKVNKYFGFVPSTINSLLFIAFVLLFAVSLPIRGDIKQAIFDSKIGGQLVEKASTLEKPFNSVFGPITKQSLTFLTVTPEEKGSVDLKFKQPNTTVDYESEQKMLTLVNAERKKVGAPVLVWNENLAKVARNHSTDMFNRGYFSHYSPEGKDVGDRLEQAFITYSVAGENLAFAPNVVVAHNGLMNSPGHKRNILDPAFRKVGIGAVDGGIYGKMFTQVFTD